MRKRITGSVLKKKKQNKKSNHRVINASMTEDFVQPVEFISTQDLGQGMAVCLYTSCCRWGIVSRILYIGLFFPARESIVLFEIFAFREVQLD